MRIFFLVFFVFLLSACSVRATFIPEGEKLNDAIVSIPYHSQINISGGRVLSHDIDGHQKIAGTIQPDDTGLQVKYCNAKKLNNCLQITGVPQKAGIARVRIYGGLSGSMFSKAGEFDKTYTITIKDSKEYP
ncbi:hypothetical protein [Erwinia sp. CGal63]|uniref:hypothetical protein n=1 Tax=Erwinia sp. CGal63 TaxID=2919889 RepID=UPI00300A213F